MPAKDTLPRALAGTYNMKPNKWKPLTKHGPREAVRGVASNAPAFEITPLGAENVELRAKVARMENALQVIMDTAQEYHEYNPVSNTARLPMGYRKILNTAHHALNA